MTAEPDDEPVVPPARDPKLDRIPEQGEFHFANTADMAKNLRHQFNDALMEILTPKKGQAAAYTGCDVLLTYVGATNQSTILVIAGLASLVGSLNNALYVGGNVPRLMQAYGILRAREMIDYLKRRRGDEDMRYPAFLSKAAFDAALQKALPPAAPEIGEGHSDSYKRTLYCYAAAGVCFVVAGATGTGFDQLLSFMKGDGQFTASEKVITGAVNAASIGYGILFALGNAMNLAHTTYLTKMTMRNAFKHAKNEPGWAAKWQKFCAHARIEHASSDTLLAASTSWLVAGTALVTGGMLYGSPMMVKAGGLLITAAAVSYVGDYCVRLDENKSLRSAFKRKSKIVYRSKASTRMHWLTSSKVRRISRIVRSIKQSMHKKNEL